jgi:hypothetical protein
MSRPDYRRQRILDALVQGYTPQQVSVMTGAPLVYVQRLADPDQSRSDREGPHSMGEKLDSPYSGYWAKFHDFYPAPMLPPPKPRRNPLVVHDPQVAAEVTKAREAYRRTARMVPDDRRDEEVDFMAVMEQAVHAERREHEGRGSA